MILRYYKNQLPSTHNLIRQLGKDNEYRTALMIGLRAGHLECVKALIAAKAELNLQDNEGRTALMIAEKAENKACSEALQAAANRESKKEQVPTSHPNQHETTKPLPNNENSGHRKPKEDAKAPHDKDPKKEQFPTFPLLILGGLVGVSLVLYGVIEYLIPKLKRSIAPSKTLKSA